MSLPNNLQGVKWRLNKGNGDGPPETFTFLCSVVTRDLDRKVEFDDNMQTDCDTPGSLSVRVSTPKAITWDVTGSGRVDAVRFRKLEADFETQTLHNYQFLRDLTAALGGGNHTGAAYVSDLKQTSSENGVVTFSFSLKGQGTLVWTPATT